MAKMTCVTVEYHVGLLIHIECRPKSAEHLIDGATMKMCSIAVEGAPLVSGGRLGTSRDWPHVLMSVAADFARRKPKTKTQNHKNPSI